MGGIYILFMLNCYGGHLHFVSALEVLIKQQGQDKLESIALLWFLQFRGFIMLRGPLVPTVLKPKEERKPNCDGPGAACYDPRFIGGDGIVFYFHGKKDEHFSLISDVTVQINARFIGLRPAGRARDFTWIQALGLMFGSHNFTLEATKAENWDQEVDHLKCTYDGMSFSVLIGHSSVWSSPDQNLELERTSATNSVRVTIQEIVEISANVVPVTGKEDAIHSYGRPKNDSFAHLEVQFRFFDLSPKVEGILGRTYQPSFKNPAKAGVDMAVVGGDNKYKTSSLLSADCNSCSVFTPGKMVAGRALPMDFGSLDCTGGNGIVCKK
ncbi:uncharacterized protein LOC107858186 [Capsicum annuum]|uniref:uncharacterized protein LOC107858186 n=1 Tax=Capsicum annuum TaxID=4072 RepID=UPI001FB15DC4|nr:uncharacterized protein LOC107858186 [Capsicum annuum]